MSESPTFQGMPLESEMPAPRYYWLRPPDQMTNDQRRLLIALGGKQSLDVTDHATGKLLATYDATGALVEDDE